MKTNRENAFKHLRSAREELHDLLVKYCTEKAVLNGTNYEHEFSEIAVVMHTGYSDRVKASTWLRNIFSNDDELTTGLLRVFNKIIVLVNRV